MSNKYDCIPGVIKEHAGLMDSSRKSIFSELSILVPRTGMARMKYFVAGTLAGIVCSAALALQPPRPGELESLQASGQVQERIKAARKLDNHHVGPGLLKKFKLRTKKDGLPSEDVQAAATTVAGGGLPASGNPKVLVLLVDFQDYPSDPANTVPSVANKLFGAGDSVDFPYESLRAYYQRSSYNALNIEGTVLGWYRAAYPRSYYENLGMGAGNTTLIDEVFTYYSNQGHDFSQYDNDGDGDIDSFFIKWTGPDNGWANFWWAYKWDYFGNNTYSGKRLGTYVWSWIANPGYDGSMVYRPRVDIHETGHLLGLPDYYDYSPQEGPRGGVGGLDMMDGNWGDHNAFSKYLLGWITPSVISAGKTRVKLTASGDSNDAALIFPNVNSSEVSPFGEFFFAQYRKRGVGNDPADYPNDGITVWHVDSTLNTIDGGFLYNNSYTPHKLIRLMEADGLEEIEQGFGANAGDFYLKGNEFSPYSIPNSDSYSGEKTGIVIGKIGQADEKTAAKIEFTKK